MTAAAVPFVFRAKSRKALLPFHSRISRAYCGGDPLSHLTYPPLIAVKSSTVIAHSDKLVRDTGRADGAEGEGAKRGVKRIWPKSGRRRIFANEICDIYFYFKSGAYIMIPPFFFIRYNIFFALPVSSFSLRFSYVFYFGLYIILYHGGGIFSTRFYRALFETKIFLLLFRLLRLQFNLQS